MARAKILITGGAGYIGSHVVHHWLEQKETAETELVVLDNLYSGHRAALPSGVEFVQGDVADTGLLERLFSQHRFDTVLHFAAHTEVGESVADPAKYYRNNTFASFGLIQASLKHGVRNFIFSSTAAVYGEPQVSPIDEEQPIAPMNPYGASKAMTERMLRDLSASSGGMLRSVCLRYFNAAGARPDLKVGQATPRATHLVKIAAEVAVGRRESLTIFGTDYPTPDGTCLRDYIHVEDLASAHVRAWTHLRGGGDSAIYNVGYGHPYSVRDVIRMMSEVSGRELRVIEGPRRAGDPSSVAADASKIRRELGWSAKYDNLRAICQSAYEFEKLLASGKWG